MLLKNTESAYGAVAKLFHWAIALLILMMLVVGFQMKTIPDGPDKLWVYGLHKSIGILVLMLVGMRIIWKLINIAPRPLPTHAPWERGLAHFVHFLLYAGMVAMPLSGWVMSSAADFRNSFFDLFEMPDIVPKDQGIFAASRLVHEILAFVIIGVFGLHLLGALKHHFIDRDETLQRMTARWVGLKAGAVLTLLVGAVVTLILFMAGNYLLERLEAAPVSAAAEQASPVEAIEAGAVQENQWLIDLTQSEIGFTATQYGEAFAGRFQRFNGEIVFDTEKLESSHAIIKIDITSIETGSAERDESAKGAEWFDTAQFPLATFRSQSFVQTGEGQYTAKGELEIRGVKVPVELPFTLRIENDVEGNRTAFMEGALELKRLDFGIGQGQWQATDTIGNPVKVSIKVKASAAK